MAKNFGGETNMSPDSQSWNAEHDACDNHPDRPAVLVTDGDGRFDTIRLCQACVPATLTKFLPNAPH